MDNKSKFLNKIKQSDPLNIFIGFSLLMAFYTGFRMPNLWSVNYYIPSMFEGFYRRSLVGTVLYVFGDLRFNYLFIVAIQITVLAALLGIVLRYAFRAEDKLKAVFVLYLLAPTGGYLFHEIGYIDQLLYLLLIAWLYAPNKHIGIALMLASLFIHEMALFTIIPIYFAYLIINKTPLRQMVMYGVLISVAFLVLFLYLQTAPYETMVHFMEKITANFGPGARTDYYYIFNNTFTQMMFDNTFVDAPGVVFRVAQGNYVQAGLLFEVGLACMLGLVVATLFCNKNNTIWQNACCFLSVWVACMSPLLLVFYGLDTMRWVFLSYSSSLILLCLYRGELPRMRFAAILFIFTLFLAYGHLWYFDGLRPRSINIQASFVNFWMHDLFNLMVHHL